MIDIIEAATPDDEGRYLVVETGAVVKLTYDIDDDGLVVNDRYTVYGIETHPTEDGWVCECDGEDDTRLDGEPLTDYSCIHIREAQKVERIAFR